MRVVIFSKIWYSKYMNKGTFQLGTQIKRLRGLKGYTQAQLAELTDLSNNFIGQIERGDRKPSIQTLEKIASALNAKIDLSIPNDKINHVLNELIDYLKDKDIEDVNLITEITKKIMNRFTDH